MTWNEVDECAPVALNQDETSNVNGAAFWVPLMVGAIRVATNPYVRTAIKGAITAGSTYLGFKAVGGKL